MRQNHSRGCVKTSLHIHTRGLFLYTQLKVVEVNSGVQDYTELRRMRGVKVKKKNKQKKLKFLQRFKVVAPLKPEHVETNHE